MTRLYVVTAAVFWVGLVLLLSRLRWFGRVSLADRLHPYAPGGMARAPRPGVLSVGSFREVITPMAQQLGARASRLFGVSEDLDLRLRRAHATTTVAEFRTRQLGWAVAAFGAGCVISVAVRPPAVFALLAIFGGPLLAFLVLEQRVQQAGTDWQRRIFLELPVITEQLGMLLSAGYSLGAALNRLARRSSGACATDLRTVCGRMRQGLSEVDALREWADTAHVDALDRLVGLLTLNREAGDLGALISEEARAIRADAHRELLELIERRGQQVWIPVTVATLVPGVLFMAVPFYEAMRLFSSG